MNSLVGVYGGTFNPIHLGHLRAAEEVVETLGLERMIFVPSANPPHKQDASSVIAPARDRLAWTRRAVEDNPRFEVSDLEMERSGKSYLVDTLRELRPRLAPATPVFTLGHDAFVDMKSWREPGELLRLAHFAVVVRPPIRSGDLSLWLPDELRDDVELAVDGLSGRHREAGTWIRLLEISGLEISASAIRELLQRGASTRYLLPEPVREEIEKSGCYAPHPEQCGEGAS